MLNAVARGLMLSLESQRIFSKFAIVLFCYITNHLMTGPLGKSEFCFPRISMFPETKSRETLRFSGNKIHCSPRDQSLSVKYFSKMKNDLSCSDTATLSVFNMCPFVICNSKH